MAITGGIEENVPSYEEIHGTITPADNTRVHKPPLPELPKQSLPIKTFPKRNQPVIKQGR